MKCLKAFREILLISSLLIITTVLVFSITFGLTKTENESNLQILNVSKEDYQVSNETNPHAKYAFPKTLSFEPIVKLAFEKLKVEEMEEFIKNFTSFDNRHAHTGKGEEAAEWLISRIAKTVREMNYLGNVTVQRFSHLGNSISKQSSAIVRVEGGHLTLKSQIVVLGAHLDAIIHVPFRPPQNHCPGADDNASGCTVLLATLRALLETNFIPKRTLEFHFYAGEKIEKFGSKEIAKSYMSSRINVISMVNFNKVGFNDGYNGVFFHNKGSYNDSPFSVFLQRIVKKYLRAHWVSVFCDKDLRCDSSDETSWSAFGVPSGWLEANALPFRLKYRDPTCASDNFETISFEKVKDFSKLATAYAIELAEPYSQ